MVNRQWSLLDDLDPSLATGGDRFHAMADSAPFPGDGDGGDDGGESYPSYTFSFVFSTNGLWLEVPTNALPGSNQFNVILHNTTNGDFYEILTKEDLLLPAWNMEMTVTGAVGSLTPVTLWQNGRTNLFVIARSAAIVITEQPISQEVLVGDMVTFTVAANGSGLTYQWTLNGTNITGATGSSYTVNSVDVSEEGNYACIITGAAGSETSQIAALIIDPGTTFLDYMIPVGPRQDYVFRSGVTYYIGSTVQLYGNTTFEPGTIIQFDYTQPYPCLQVLGTVTCKGTPFNPSILTTEDDITFGEPFTVNADYPLAYVTGVPYLDLSQAGNISLSNCRFRFADIAVSAPANGRLDIWDCQFFQCDTAIINPFGGADSLHNVLVAGGDDVVAAFTNSFSLSAEQLTADVVNLWDASISPSSMKLTNSVVLGNASTATLVNSYANPDLANLQTSGAGNYYLAPGSALHNAGTTNISPGLLSEFHHKTTYAPLALTTQMALYGNLTLAPQVPHYTNGPPDVGYYYEAIDYTLTDLTNFGTINILPGTVVGMRTDPYLPSFWGMDLREESSLVCHGTPTRPITFVDTEWVQEQYGLCYSLFVPDFEGAPNDVAPVMDFRFCNFYPSPVYYSVWAGMGEGGSYMASYNSAVNWILRDCNVHGGWIELGEPDNTNFFGIPYTAYYGSGAVVWDNNLFDHVTVNLQPTWGWFDGTTINVDLAFLAYNNLFRNGSGFTLIPAYCSAGNWAMYDNLFDNINFWQVPMPLDFDHNGYWPFPAPQLFLYHANQLQATETDDGTTDGLNDVILSSAPPYTNGPFGDYYLSTLTPLYQAGSRTAGAAGLAQYTAFLAQAKDAASQPVNIGLHYVAATNNAPLDTDGDGIPDYMEDANENGVVDANETDWTTQYTTSGVWDPTNTLYDNTDLSGDGLIGAAKQFFGVNPLTQNNPLDLLDLPQQSTVSGLVQIPLNFSTSIDTNSTFTLQVDGISQSTVVYQTNGNWFAAWDTTAVENGNHQLSMEYDLDENTPIMGAAKFVNVQNAICFPYNNNLPMCGDALTVQALTIYTNGIYTMDVYDDSSNLISETSGDIDSNGYCDDPNTSQPNITVSLLDTNGNHFTSESYEVVVAASGNNQNSGQIQPADAGTGSSSSSSSAKHYAFYSHSMAGQHRWVVVYYPVYGTVASGSQAAANVAEMMEDAAEAVHVSAYGTQDDGVVNNANTTTGIPYSISLDGANQWNTLKGLLQDGRSRNFFYFGHGATDFIGVKKGNHLSADDIAGFLNNSARNLATGDLSVMWGHPYRFVFLDGCETASGNLPLVFGIPNCIVPQTNWDYRVHCEARAFLGWNGHIANSVKNTLPVEHQRFINDFWEIWGGGDGHRELQTSINNAAINPVNNQVFTSLNQKIVLYGCPTLPFYQ